MTEAFKADSDPRKLNLGVGAYRTEDGRPLVLSAVRKAEERLLGAAGRDKEYLPMGGNAGELAAAHSKPSQAACTSVTQPLSAAATDAFFLAAAAKVTR